MKKFLLVLCFGIFANSYGQEVQYINGYNDYQTRLASTKSIMNLVKKNGDLINVLKRKKSKLKNSKRIESLESKISALKEKNIKLVKYSRAVKDQNEKFVPADRQKIKAKIDKKMQEHD